MIALVLFLSLAPYGVYVVRQTRCSEGRVTGFATLSTLLQKEDIAGKNYSTRWTLEYSLQLEQVHSAPASDWWSSVCSG
jgi:hypothetical protein